MSLSVSQLTCMCLGQFLADVVALLVVWVEECLLCPYGKPNHTGLFCCTCRSSMMPSCRIVPLQRIIRMSIKFSAIDYYLFILNILLVCCSCALCMEIMCVSGVRMSTLLLNLGIILNTTHVSFKPHSLTLYFLVKIQTPVHKHS